MRVVYRRPMIDLLGDYRAEVADLSTRIATDASLFNDVIRMTFITENRVLRALRRTESATGAEFRIDAVMEKSLADTRRTFAVEYVCVVLVPEVFQRAEHRVRRCLTESAQRRVANDFRELLKQHRAFETTELVLRAVFLLVHGDAVEDSQASASCLRDTDALSHDSSCTNP